jgi:hypothetical protein
MDWAMKKPFAPSGRRTADEEEHQRAPLDCLCFSIEPFDRDSSKFFVSFPQQLINLFAFSVINPSTSAAGLAWNTNNLTVNGTLSAVARVGAS